MLYYLEFTLKYHSTTIKDTGTKPKGRVEVGGGMAVVGWRGEEKMQTTVIEQQLKNKIRYHSRAMCSVCVYLL